MFCSYVPGVPTDWNAKRFIVRYTSPDLWKWTCHGPLPLSSEKVIDACVERHPNGRWRLWYKDEAHSSHSWCAESPDLANWKVLGPAITNKGHEGPNVFQWKGFWWLLTDHWDGLEFFQSTDCENWKPQANLLKEPGTRRDDGVKGGHADVLVNGDDAWIFYFTHPGRTPDAPKGDSYQSRRTSIQVAKLEITDGVINCRRNEPFPFELKPELDNWHGLEWKDRAIICRD